MSEPVNNSSEFANSIAEKANELAIQAQQLANEVQEAAPIADSAGAAASAATGGAIDPFIFQFAIFVMAIFVGYYVVWSVTPALHTPLMAVTNAISGIIIVGALLQIGSDVAVVKVLATVSVLIATINIAGGFLVTQRMLKMFQK